LQNERRYVPPEIKIKLIKTLAQAGVTAIEATSFVHPRAVPQLKDAEVVLKGLEGLPERLVLSALVGNVKGIQRAAGTGVREVVVVISASDAHNRANLNMTTRQSLQELRAICALASEKGIRVRGAVATAFGCPYQGHVREEEVHAVVESMLDEGIGEITLADTAGMANPRQVYELYGRLAGRYSGVQWALHFHDTRGLALANITAAIQAGAGRLESSVGGLGGCPFIPGAAGNVATEKLVYMLDQMGIRTGIELGALLKCTRIMEDFFERKFAFCLNKTLFKHLN
ncbi:MAG: hydroxymethylglutaryl-CoA lyase, partial [Peptococcaceae bacterium]|nr:hydroxymethylglutaryl-CoA lyase [Peptococcaceae bacterium]